MEFNCYASTTMFKSMVFSAPPPLDPVPIALNTKGQILRWKKSFIQKHQSGR